MYLLSSFCGPRITTIRMSLAKGILTTAQAHLPSLCMDIYHTPQVKGKRVHNLLTFTSQELVMQMYGR